MTYWVYKVLGLLAVPSNLLAAVGLLGVLLMAIRRSRRTGQALTVSVVLLFAVIGLSPVGYVLLRPLEERFPPWDASRGAPDGLVVLGGALVPEVMVAGRDEIPLNESAERMIAAVRLAHRYPTARIVFSGGIGLPWQPGPTEADSARSLFEQLSVPAARIVFEDRSRTTAESALLSKAAADLKPGERWLLVTSAWHMPRSVGVFRRAGFPVEAYLTDWRTRGQDDLWLPPGTVGEGLRRFDLAMHEWIGLLAYWLAGRSSELFPGPQAHVGCDDAGLGCVQG